MENTNYEIRNLEQPQSELRAISNTRNIEGYGIVFGKMSRDLGGFKEIILPEAIEGVIEKSDILALLNHDINRGVLARCTRGKGTLELNIDKKGVRYGFEAPKTGLGDQVIEGIRRGDIKTSSFAFSIVPGTDKWEKRGDENIRIVTNLSEIHDVGPCYREAYEDTSVALRSLNIFTKTNPAPKKDYRNMSETEMKEVIKKQRQDFLEAQSQILKFGYGKPIR